MPVRFAFAERLREDATETIARLRAIGLKLHLLSGDHRQSVQRIAAQLGIDDWRCCCRWRWPDS
jgi:Cu2+-exporting ATPase